MLKNLNRVIDHLHLMSLLLKQLSQRVAAVVVIVVLGKTTTLLLPPPPVLVSEKDGGLA